MDFWGHLKTITRHKFTVMKYCFKIGLYKQGLLHDLSKYSPVEFSEGVKYFQGDRSPNNKAREVNGITYAWLHHKGRNKHHYEYWIDYDKNSPGSFGGMRMPRKYVAEMAMDRIAACKVYQREKYTDASALEYLVKNKGHMQMMHKETMRELESILTMLRDKGEKEAFRYVKQVYLKEKKA